MAVDREIDGAQLSSMSRRDREQGERGSSGERPGRHLPAARDSGAARGNSREAVASPEMLLRGGTASAAEQLEWSSSSSSAASKRGRGSGWCLWCWVEAQGCFYRRERQEGERMVGRGSGGHAMPPKASPVGRLKQASACPPKNQIFFLLLVIQQARPAGPSLVMPMDIQARIAQTARHPRPKFARAGSRGGSEAAWLRGDRPTGDWRATKSPRHQRHAEAGDLATGHLVEAGAPHHQKRRVDG